MNRELVKLFDSWRINDKTVKHSVSKPEVIGYYSVDGDRNYLADSSEMLYYNPPKLGPVYLDLNEGIESAVNIWDHDIDGHINRMLTWIKLNKEKILASEPRKWNEPEFAASTGLLAMIMVTPFRPEDDWVIRAAKWQGTIYLCRFKTRLQKHIHFSIPRRCLSWGFKFTQYVASERPDEAPDTSRPVMEPAEFRCIMKGRFGTHNMLYCKNVDAVRSKKLFNDPLPLEELKFVDLKLTRIRERWHETIQFHKRNLVVWWAQSFVSGSDDVLCGFHDADGIVRKLENYKRDEIVEMCKRYWNPQTCIDYCEKFLSYVAGIVVEDCDKAIYKFEYLPYGSMTSTKESPISSHAFIPSSFMQKP